MSDSLCFELYHYGSLGRFFIDLALLYIDKTQYYMIGDKICIRDPARFAKELNGILEEFSMKGIKCFHLTGNDNKSIRNALGSFFHKDDPTTIVRFVIGSLESGGYNNLSKTLTAPAVARIEFFEYSKPGYVTRISDSHKNHPYKTINVFSLALAVLGGYIGFVTKGGKGIIVYLLPTQKIEASILKKVKEEIAASLNAPPNILSYTVAKYIRELRIFRGSLLGYLLSIDVSGNRPTLIRNEPLSSEGMDLIISRLSSESLQFLDTIMSILRRYYAELNRTKKSRTFKNLQSFAGPLITIMSDIYRASRGSTEALYDCVRTAILVRDNIIRAFENQARDSPWIKLYYALKDGLENPLKNLNIFIRDTSNIIKSQEWRGIYEF